MSITTPATFPAMPGAASFLEDIGRNASAIGLKVFESWMDDASRAQKEWLALFNRRLDKDRAVVAGLMQCASLGVFIDLQTEYWGGLANDYAQWAQRGLCWLGDATQHAVDDIKPTA